MGEERVRGRGEDVVAVAQVEDIPRAGVEPVSFLFFILLILGWQC